MKSRLLGLNARLATLARAPTVDGGAHVRYPAGMTIPAAFASLVGNWGGTYSLWLEPEKPVRESPSTATVELVGAGKFLSLRYTWSFDGKAQEGMLLVGQDKAGAVRAPFIDSWHNGDTIMICAGTVAPDGAIDVKGSYAAPPGPDWGWRTTLAAGSEGELRMRMFNVEPDGTETLAVDLVLRRG